MYFEIGNVHTYAFNYSANQTYSGRSDSTHSPSWRDSCRWAQDTPQDGIPLYHAVKRIQRKNKISISIACTPVGILTSRPSRNFSAIANGNALERFLTMIFFLVMFNVLRRFDERLSTLDIYWNSWKVLADSVHIGIEYYKIVFPC